MIIEGKIFTDLPVSEITEKMSMNINQEGDAIIIDKHHAAQLIEECGLKGFTVGNAQVSEKHSGFVINRGGASFDDVMAVIAEVKRTVAEKTGYKLECEPIIISEREEYRK